MFLKKLNIDKILEILFLLGLFFFSFNHIEIMPFMGEYVRESGAIFFFVGFFIMCLEGVIKGSFHLPLNNKLYQLLLIFYFITIICTVINIPTVTENYFKRTTGISRFIRQMISLSIPVFLFISLFWRVIKNWSTKDIFLKIRRVFLYTLLFGSFYGTFEILYSSFGIYPAKYVLELISDIFPFLDPYYHSEGRISIFAYEPPFLAIYLITISGWMFSYILTEHKVFNQITPTLLLLILTFFSGSRTALLVILFILFLFVTYLYKKKLHRNVIHNVVIVSIGLFTLTFFLKADQLMNTVNEKIESLNFTGNLKTNISNKTRFGMQVASIEVFKDNPIFGVGYGQQPFHTRHHYPYWATVNNWEFDELYKNKLNPSFPPGYNLFTRILAELGIVGFISWCIILIYCLYLCYKIYKNTYDEYSKLLVLSISITLIGLYINWLQTDIFRMYGFWLNVVILIRLFPAIQEKIEKYD